VLTVQAITVIKLEVMVVRHIMEQFQVVLVILEALVDQVHKVQAVVEVVHNHKLLVVPVAQERSFTGFYV
jgi:hypothetical protein